MKEKLRSPMGWEVRLNRIDNEYLRSWVASIIWWDNVDRLHAFNWTDFQKKYIADFDIDIPDRLGIDALRGALELIGYKNIEVRLNSLCQADRWSSALNN